MLVTKNLPRGAILFLALVIFVAGCTPPGPRAVLKGKKFLERGDYAAAVEQLKTATTLLPANAQAWNYLGVACQRAGDSTSAVTAYQRALTLDRDLMEAHYNLGSLWLEQNKLDLAKMELTAYTLRRNNAPEGWLKLGSVQLHADEFVAAEKSFSTALYLNPNNAEAYNGLGLARIERGRARDAAAFFAAAIQYHPDYAPAILNLATVAQESLHDNKFALQNYHAYLALTPRPDNWDAVNAIANNLENQPKVAAENPPVANQNVAPTPPTMSEPKSAQPIVHQAMLPRTQSVTRSNFNPPAHAVTSMPMQVVKIQPEPAIILTPDKTENADQTTSEAARPAPKKSGVLHKLNPLNWFGSSKPQKNYEESGVTPLPSSESDNDRVISTPLSPAANSPSITTMAAPQEISQKPIKIVQSAPPTFPRYLYLSPRKAKSGDHSAAAGAFTKAREFEQDARWPDAMEWYRRAADYDPAWFEAQYNYGVVASRLRNFNAALAANERALAIQPDSVDARYNFALTLKAAGYVMDAANELKKVIAANPDEVRAQLALGNLYAQQLRDPARARQHYLKVLELDPRNAQATDIRFWLSSNPQ